jgi:Fic family protein
MNPRALWKSEAEKVQRIETNLARQYKVIEDLVVVWDGEFQMTAATIKELHRLAMQGIYSCAGQFRSNERSFRARSVKIEGSSLPLIEDEYVEGMVEHLCERVNEKSDWNPLKTSAYLLWRLNWIHPFHGGNGRTSRAVAYLALCVRVNAQLPGDPSITEYCIKNRDQYIEALQDADAACAAGAEDVSQLESLLDVWLRKQIASRSESKG